MFIWVLHLTGDDGTYIVKPFTDVKDIIAFVQSRVSAESWAYGGSMSPKLGDRITYEADGHEVAYAVLGQIRFD
jgi:hypothetical protein